MTTKPKTEQPQPDFADPEIAGRRDSTTWGPWRHKLEIIAKFPNRWAIVAGDGTHKNNPKGLKVYLEKQYVRNKLPPGRWEFVGSQQKVYAKFLGPAE